MSDKPKTVRVGVKLYKIKPLSVLDFLDDDKGVPFSLFELKKNQGIYGQMCQDIDQKHNTSENYAKIIQKVLEKGLVRKKDYEKVIVNTKVSVILANTIISLSTKIFSKLVKIDKNTALYWDQMAKRYGKTPIECLNIGEKYSSLDAFMFNSFIINTAVEQENINYKRSLQRANRKK